MDGWRLGVDYGSSHTVAVLARPDGGVRPLTFDGSPLLSSAVYADPGGGLLTGPDALSAAQLDPARFEPHPKRQIDAGGVLLGDRDVPVADMIAATLGRVAEEVSRVTGGAAVETVLTHPAGWGPARRATLRTAAVAAGFAAPVMLAEPVAAARYFLETAGTPDVPVAVFDLGGGTFDVCVVRGAGGDFEIVASDGLADLGGVDLDAIVVDLLAEAVRAADPGSWTRLLSPSTPAERRHFRTLWDRARQAKESLSRRTMATVAVPLLDREAHVTREQFERAAAPTLGLTVDLTVGLLRRAGLRAEALGGIFLVGGATRTPLVGTLLHRATGRPPTVLDQPELVVAEGALRHGPRLASTTSTMPPPPATSVPPPSSSAVPPPSAAEQPEPASKPAAVPAEAPPAVVARADGMPAQQRWHGSRGKALGGLAFNAGVVVLGLWYAISNSGSLQGMPVGGQVFLLAVLVVFAVAAIGNIWKVIIPDYLVVDANGIYLQRIRLGRGLQRVALPWGQLSEAFVGKVDLEPHLVVRTQAGPVDGAALTGRRYRTDVSGFALCKLTEVGAPADELRVALATRQRA